MLRRSTFLAATLLVGLAIIYSGAFAQETPKTLTLQEALRLARERNGDVRAAALSAQASSARVDQAKAEFFPSIIPSYTYSSDRNEIIEVGTDTVFVQSDGGSSRVSASMRLLDLGERSFSLRSSQASAASQRATALQTLRSILFLVHQQYYDTLRAQELVRVAQAQVGRAQKVLEQTEAQVAVGESARKDILQAQADLANARVQELFARNRNTNAQATLKATIGWDTIEPLPQLVAAQPPAEFPEPAPLVELVGMGLKQRADLFSTRKRTDSLRFNSLRADREATASLGVDANFDQLLTPVALENRSLSLSLSLPWLDGGRSRATARESRLSLAAQRKQLEQAEREARSEIEAAYQEVKQNADRVKAANTALEAARLNYEAASESQRLGAGTIIEVITAQVSLVTAESNFVEALYDYETAVVKLRLATGQAIPGE